MLRVRLGDDRLDGGEIWLRAGGEYHRPWGGTERVSGARSLLQDRPLYGAYVCCGNYNLQSKYDTFCPTHLICTGTHPLDSLQIIGLAIISLLLS